MNCQILFFFFFFFSEKKKKSVLECHLLKICFELSGVNRDNIHNKHQRSTRNTRFAQQTRNVHTGLRLGGIYVSSEQTQ